MTRVDNVSFCIQVSEGQHCGMHSNDSGPCSSQTHSQTSGAVGQLIYPLWSVSLYRPLFGQLSVLNQWQRVRDAWLAVPPNKSELNPFSVISPNLNSASSSSSSLFANSKENRRSPCGKAFSNIFRGFRRYEVACGGTKRVNRRAKERVQYSRILTKGIDDLNRQRRRIQAQKNLRWQERLKILLTQSPMSISLVSYCE